MAKRDANRLDPLTVGSLVKGKKAGRHADGHGLYLVVESNGAARWSFLFRWKAGRPGPGRLREMGLGSTSAVSLKRAREKAADARALVADGIDPIAHRKATSAIPTFGELADEFLANKTQESRSKAAIARLKRSLETYCEPLRPRRVDQIDTDAVLGVLRPIWLEKPETAQKTRGYIEAVLNAAKAKGQRAGDNPAAWRGHLDHLLPRPSKLAQGHHAAMPRDQLAGFMSQLRSREAMAARALEYLVLTAARVSEVLGATWAEIDLTAKVWTVPAARMKNGLEHRVPLSERAVEILKGLADARVCDLVFPGRGNRPLSGAAFERLLTRMKVEGAVPHGFRSTFRDWCGEETSYPREIAEAALAHTVGDQTERAYRRGDALERRRQLMETWAKFCAGEKGLQLVAGGAT